MLHLPTHKFSENCIAPDKLTFPKDKLLEEEEIVIACFSVTTTQNSFDSSSSVTLSNLTERTDRPENISDLVK